VFLVTHHVSMMATRCSQSGTLCPSVLRRRGLGGRKGIRPVKVLPQQFPKIYFCRLAQPTVTPENGPVIQTSTKGTMDTDESARNSCNSWPLYAC